jgi:hypothetical protein
MQKEESAIGLATDSITQPQGKDRDQSDTNLFAGG